MKIKFAKYHGTGNDFILVDNRENIFDPTKDQIAFLCHRRFGIGADGLILLGNSEMHDFSMKYYNADGGEGSMCGNGGRCIAAFAESLGIIKDVVIFEAVDGEHIAKMLASKDELPEISLKMSDVNDIIRFGEDYVLDTGSPHLVRFVENLEKVNVYSEGKRLRWHPAFQPGGINVNFVQRSEDQLAVRSFERGVEDITLSCGTGVTACALAASRFYPQNPGYYKILTDGGKLNVRFTKDGKGFSDIWLEGPAVKVFEGEAEI